MKARLPTTSNPPHPVQQSRSFLTTWTRCDSPKRIDPANRSERAELMREIRLVYLRNGARDWHLYEDFVRSNRFQMEVVASSWSEYQRQHERLTKDEKELLDRLATLRVDTNHPEEFIRVSINKEVIKKNLKS